MVPEALKAPFTRPAVNVGGQPPHLVDRAGIWMVPEAPIAVVAFMKLHHDGMTLNGSGGASTDHGRVITRSLSLSPTGAFGSDVTDVEVEESVSATAGGSLLRADALTVWLNPRDADEHVPANDHVVTITRTGSLAGTATKARSLVVTNPATVARLASIFNSLPVALDGPRGCVADFGVAYTVAFRTSQSAPADILVRAGACQSLVEVRGHAATALETGALLQAAARLLHIAPADTFKL